MYCRSHGDAWPSAEQGLCYSALTFLWPFPSSELVSLFTRGTYGLLQGVRALGLPLSIIPGSAGSLNNQSVGRLRSSTAQKSCRTKGSLRMIGPRILESTSLKDCLILPSDGQPYHRTDLFVFFFHNMWYILNTFWNQYCPPPSLQRYWHVCVCVCHILWFYPWIFGLDLSLKLRKNVSECAQTGETTKQEHRQKKTTAWPPKSDFWKVTKLSSIILNSIPKYFPIYIPRYIFLRVHFYLCLFVNFFTTLLGGLIFLFILTPQGSHVRVVFVVCCICGSCVYVCACIWSIRIRVYVFMLCLAECEMYVIVVCVFEVVCIYVVCIRFCGTCVYWCVYVHSWYVCGLCLEDCRICVYLECGWLYICGMPVWHMWSLYVFICVYAHCVLESVYKIVCMYSCGCTH